ncbi:hypothetical protein SAMN04487881_2183 [Marinobacter sp. es.048]|uniref:hypothetical protein n=1 Tax=Marinobacter sp. es.048 TaxID=1761795 RepID=UPI000B6F8D39|nr:hypothetical protein [Marinobacter sp. es.048]SNC68127.1 hypothetical protein SAMN04487881_2183 [Marinobacter sp. es.048]
MIDHLHKPSFRLLADDLTRNRVRELIVGAKLKHDKVHAVTISDGSVALITFVNGAFPDKEHFCRTDADRQDGYKSGLVLPFLRTGANINPFLPDSTISVEDERNWRLHYTVSADYPGCP